MSRTKHIVRGNEYHAKTKDKPKDVKFLGFTSGLHSNFEKTKAFLKKEFEESTPTDPWYNLKKKHWDDIKDKTYPEKGVDYVKHGYGTGNKNRIKNYQKEIE